jgi:hypothetical protein
MRIASTLMSQRNTEINQNYVYGEFQNINILDQHTNIDTVHHQT